MGRQKSAGVRVRGPYHDQSRDRWRVDWFGADGRCRPRYFASEHLADNWIERFEFGAASQARTTAEAIPRYLEHLRAKEDRENSIETTRWALSSFFPEPLVLVALDTAHCQVLYDAVRTRPRRVQVDGEWVVPAEGPPMSADSHRGILKQAKSFLRWCASKGWTNGNPADGVQGIGRLRKRGKSLGKAGRRVRVREARAFYLKALELARVGDTSATVALVAVLCGMRASEICRLRVRDLDSVDLDGDVLHVEGRKNDEDLEVEVPEDLRPVLVKRAEGRDPGEFLFAHGPGSRKARRKLAGRPYGRRFVLDSVHRVCEAAGVPMMTAHACRGLLATVAAERGMAGHLIAATLGNDEKVMSTSYAAPGALEAGGRRRGLAVLQGGKR